MNNSKMLSRYFIILLLLLLRLPASASSLEEWKEQLIEQGRKQLKEAQAQNLLNEKAGKGYLNNYLIIVSTDDGSGPQYIRQHYGTGSGQRSLMLNNEELAMHNRTLQQQNINSEVKTYLLLIDYIPLEFDATSYSLNDDESIISVITQNTANKENEATRLATKAKTEASDIVTRITKTVLDTARTPTLYCGLVQFKVFLKERNVKGMLTYFPKSSNIGSETEYRQLLDSHIKALEWSSLNNNNVANLINAIGNCNSNYKQIKGTLANITSVTSHAEIFKMLENMDAHGYSAFTLEQRLHILKVLTSTDKRTNSSGTTNSTSNITNARELKIIDILKYTATSDINALLEGLKGSNEYADNKTLINCIVSGTDDSMVPWGDDNYKSLMVTLIELVTRSSNYNERIATITESQNPLQKLIIWDRNYALKFFTTPPHGTNSYTATLVSNGNIKLQREFVESWNFQERTTASMDLGLQTSTSTTANWKVEPEIDLAPFELVGFVNRADLGLLTEATGGSREIIMVPAIFLKYAADKELNDILAKSAFLALDVATIAIPITKVYNLSKIGQRIYFAIDVASAVGSVGSIALITTELGNDTTFSYVIQSYLNVMAAINVAQLTSTGLTKSLAGNYIHEANLVEKELYELSKNGNTRAKQMLNLKEELLAQGNRIYENDWVSGVKKVRTLAKGADVVLKRLGSSLNSSLNSNELAVLSSKLENQNCIRFDNAEYIIQTPKTFLNEASESLYDLVIDNKFYVKYDLGDGRILLGDIDGNYYAFAQTKNKLIVQVDKDAYAVIKSHIIEQAEKLKGIVGLSGGKTISLLNKVQSLSASKVSTFIGRTWDIDNIKVSMGDFKNLDLGEVSGGINILNKPDVYFNWKNWWVDHNSKWIQRAISRGDDVYIATEISAKNLVNDYGPSFYAYELKALIDNDIKPLNISVSDWEKAKNIVIDVLK
jgi:hypothetical protein